MKRKHLAGFAACLAVVSLPVFSGGGKPSTMAEWERCGNKAVKAAEKDCVRQGYRASECFGASGGGMTDVILSACGPKPLIKTKYGLALDKKSCDEAYKFAYAECRTTNKQRLGGEGYKGELSNSAGGYLDYLDPKVFKREEFDSLCIQENDLSRKDFGALVCGE